MAEQKIYSKSRSHWDNDGDLMVEGGSGEDEHSFSIPNGQKFSRYELEINANTMFSGASVVATPQSGATGSHKIKVKWNFNPFGKIAYTLKVFAGEPEPVDVFFGPPHAPQQAFDLIKQRRALNLIISGPDALAMANAVRKAKNLPQIPHDQTSYTANLTGAEVTAIAIICATVVAVVALLVIGAICLVAIQYNYDVDIDYRRNGPLPFDDRLTIKLRPNPA